jgi:hypothetical protein
MSKTENDINVGKQILTTRGVTSCVYIPELDERTNEDCRTWSTMHVGLHDFDDGRKKASLLNDVLGMEGINILWMSSEQPGLKKYHFWNLTCKTVNEIALQGLILNSDCKHVSHGYRRSKWVLRIAGKWRDGQQYKEPPELLHTWCNPSIRPQSIPHFRLFEALTGKTICDNESYTWIGESANIETYMTLTDKMKAAMK